MERLKEALEEETPLARPRVCARRSGAYRGLSIPEPQAAAVVGQRERRRDAAEHPGRSERACAESKKLSVIAMSGKVEMEIAQLNEDEQREFLQDLGITEPARDRFIRAAYSLLDLMSFLTSGEDECRAWSIRRGTTAHKAAGVIHSDIERGFIRAEVVRFEDLTSSAAKRAAANRASSGWKAKSTLFRMATWFTSGSMSNLRVILFDIDGTLIRAVRRPSIAGGFAICLWKSSALAGGSRKSISAARPTLRSTARRLSAKA